VVVQSTEMTGESVFQEVVDAAAIDGIEDPWRQRVLGALRDGGSTVPST
jgi:hypothetical protein